MKILTYNVNGIRAALRKEFSFWLKAVNPDIICLQEIKANPEQFEASVFADLGYHCFWNPAEKKGYSGVAILTKTKPQHVEYDCGIEEIDFASRNYFIKKHFGWNRFPSVVTLPYGIVHNTEEVEVQHDLQLAAGYEGSILRKNENYECKRYKRTVAVKLCIEFPHTFNQIERK